jgi:ubiquinone/menaquinone biosynthesis C-methylase UbiE
MPDLIYTNPRLAAVYDVLNPLDKDSAFYLRLAGQTPQRVLDMGCGTGHLALALAEQGHQVTGADPALGMLGVARGKAGAEQVMWVEAEAAQLDLTDRFDLIIMTGHVFQVFLTDEEIHETLVNLRKHLGKNGRLTFETRNPAFRAWEEWTRDKTIEQLAVPDIGLVTIYYDWQTAEDNLVTFGTHFRFANDEMMAVPSTLRFMNQAELAQHLRQAGFTNFEWFGYWDGTPLQADSPEIIVIAS